MSNPSPFATELATGLTEKFADASEYASKCFQVKPGRRFDKIVQGRTFDKIESVHCFVERATGHVYKAASMKAPAEIVRFTNVQDAILNADLYGTYLYMN